MCCGPVSAACSSLPKREKPDLVLNKFTSIYFPLTLLHPRRYVTAVAVSPTMPWIATGSMDRTVNVWRIGDGENTVGKYITEKGSWGRCPTNTQSLLFKLDC